MIAFRACALVPTYENAATIADVVARVRAFLPDVVVVDDGSSAVAHEAIAALARAGLAHVHRRERNGGKGAAVKDGLRVAHDRGFTHALQVDADGQHRIEDVPRLLAAARAQPRALVLGQPLLDASAPRARVLGRALTRFWVNVETGGRVIADPMCGFRVYPVEAALRAGARGDAMDFDPEIAVRMAWDGAPVVNVPTEVRYLPAAAGGVSHFRLGRDNALITLMHMRLCALALWRLLRGRPLAARREAAAP